MVSVGNNGINGVTYNNRFPTNKTLEKQLEKEIKSYNKIVKKKEKTFYQTVNKGGKGGLTTVDKIAIGAGIALVGYFIYKQLK